MKQILALIALLTLPALACAQDNTFAIRKVVEPDTPDAIKAEYTSESKTLYLDKIPALTTEHLSLATCKHSGSGTYLELELTSAGGKLFSELTAKLQGKMVAFLVNDEVLTAPVIREQITSGSLVISGSFSEKEVQAMARTLNRSVFENSKETLTFTGNSVVYRTPDLEYVFPILEGDDISKLAPGLTITGYKEREAIENGREVDQSSIMVLGSGIERELKTNIPVKVLRREVVDPDGNLEVWWKFE